MERKNDVDKINLEITDVRIGKNPEVNNGCLVISWSSDIGFGEYTISLRGNKLIGDSETMDAQHDKQFIKKLMELLIDKLEII